MTFPFPYALCKHVSLDVNSEAAPVRTGRRVERVSRGLSGVCWSPWPAGLCSAAPADCKQITHTENTSAQAINKSRTKHTHSLSRRSLVSCFVPSWFTMLLICAAKVKKHKF